MYPNPDWVKILTEDTETGQNIWVDPATGMFIALLADDSYLEADNLHELRRKIKNHGLIGRPISVLYVESSRIHWDEYELRYDGCFDTLCEQRDGMSVPVNSDRLKNMILRTDEALDECRQYDRLIREMRQRHREEESRLNYAWKTWISRQQHIDPDTYRPDTDQRE
jgi:hypothetical protein